MTGFGPLIILPIKYLDDVKSINHVTMTGWAKRDLLSGYPGLEVFAANDPIFTAVVRQKLTQALGGLTASLVEEANELFEEELGTAHGTPTCTSTPQWTAHKQILPVFV